MERGRTTPELIIHTDKMWIGMDQRTTASELPVGTAQVIENAYADNTGPLACRDGFLGQWTTALGAAVYTLCKAEVAAGTQVILTCAGKLYRYVPGATSPVEILDAGAVSFAMPSGGSKCFVVQNGRFLYGVDGDTATYPFRVDTTTWTTVRLTGLTAPTTAPTVALATKATDTLVSTDWAGVGAPVPAWTSGTINLNESFENPTRAGTPGAWTFSGGAFNSSYATSWIFRGQTERWESPGPASTYTPQFGIAAVLLDQPDNSVECTVTAIPHFSNALPDLPTRGARIFVAATQIQVTEAQPVLAPYKIRLTAYTSGGTIIQVKEQAFTVPKRDNLTANEMIPCYAVISMGTLDAEVTSIKYELLSSEFMVGMSGAGVGAGVFIDKAEIVPSQLRFVSADDPTATKLRVSRVIRSGLAEAQSISYIAGCWVRRTFSAAQDWSGKTALRVGIAWNPAVLSGLAAGGYPSLTMGFQSAGGSVTWTPPIAYSADGTYFTASLANIPAAILASLKYFYIRAESDLNPTTDPNAYLFDFGPITEQYLTAGLNYRYFYSYFAGTVPSDPTLRVGIESSASPVAADVLASTSKQSATVTIPAGSPPTGTTHFLLWRDGDSFGDGRGRLMAALPAGANVTAGGYTWNFTTRVFTDFTPDTALLNADRYEERRDLPPIGSVDVQVLNGRLELASKNVVRESWILSTDAADGVYFTNTPDRSDPEHLTKGTSFTVDGPDAVIGILRLSTRPARSITEYGTLRVAWRQTDHVPISGADPGSFVAHPPIAEGLLASHALAHDNYARAYHVSSRGVFRIAGEAGGSGYRSSPLESLLSSSAVNSATAYRRIGMVWHNLRLWVFAPESGHATNNVCYVWDSRVGDNEDHGWSRMRSSVVSGFTTGVTLSGQADVEDLYLGGEDGMLYRLTGTVDKASAAGTATAITMRLVTRQMGKKDGTSMYVTNQKTPVTLGLSVEVAANCTMTWTVRNEKGRYVQGTWALKASPAPVQDFQTRIRLPIAGTLHEVELSIPCTTATKIRTVQLGTLPRGPRLN